MDKRIIQDFKNSWRNINAATLGFAKAIPPQEWETKPFNPRFKTFAWEFACLTRTRMCYLKALKTGQLKFSHQDDIPDKDVLEKTSKKEIIDLLVKFSKDLLTQIEKVDENKMSKILWLFQHERIHHGKLILYLSQASFKLPESFVETWGESNFHKKSV
jgi:hypothetical protein